MWWSEPHQTGRGAHPLLLRATLLVVLQFLVAGCGFELRGSPDLPPQMAVTYIQADDRHSPFFRELSTTLRRNGVRVTSDPAAAGAVLRILTDDTGRRLLTVTARNVPAEYEVYYRIRFSAEFDGTEVIPPEQLALARDLAFDPTVVLGKAGEEEILRQSLAADLVGLVTRRLAAVR